MMDLVYPRERSLGRITLVLGVLAWLVLVLGTFGAALVGLAIGFLLYLFVQSALISYIKGNGVELTAEQFPDLHEQFLLCCDKLDMNQRPHAYVMHGGGHFNAFATRFLGTHFVVLFSEVVDAMALHPDGVRFYMGHELGHIRMKHLTGQLLRWPVLWLPLIGAAYSRARESTCDRHGLVCSSSPENAARAMAALSAGGHRWQSLNLKSYTKQVNETRGFWMSLHELLAGYPWLTKRVARVMDTRASMPSRHPLSYVLAVFVPYGGRMGSGFGLIVMIYIIGVLAAVAIPAYQDYKVRSVESVAYQQAKPVQAALTAHFNSTHAVPASLADVGQSEHLVGGANLRLNSENMVLTVGTAHGDLILRPQVNDQGQLRWTCSFGEGLKAQQVPADCKTPAQE